MMHLTLLLSTAALATAAGIGGHLGGHIGGGHIGGGHISGGHTVGAYVGTRLGGHHGYSSGHQEQHT